MSNQQKTAAPDPRAVQVVKGYKFPASFQNVAQNLEYEAQAEDVFVLAFPKSGTTWMQHVVTLILNGGHMPDVYQERGVNGMSPYLDRFGGTAIREAERPFAIKSHLPFPLIPKHAAARYVLMIRNPKDTCVSFYHHTNMFANFDMDFHSFFPLWMDGQFPCGDYFDYVLSYWNERHSQPNLLVLFYEHMKRSPAHHVLIVAKFLGQSHADRLTADNNRLLDMITEKTSFDQMRESVNRMFARDTPVPMKGGRTDFLRRGVVADWRNLMTTEESLLLDQVMQQRLAGTGLLEQWDSTDIATLANN